MKNIEKSTSESKPSAETDVRPRLAWSAPVLRSLATSSAEINAGITPDLEGHS